MTSASDRTTGGWLVSTVRVLFEFVVPVSSCDQVAFGCRHQLFLVPQKTENLSVGDCVSLLLVTFGEELAYDRIQQEQRGHNGGYRR